MAKRTIGTCTITKDDPTLKFILYLNFKFMDFEMGADNSAKKILDIVYIRRAFGPLKFDPRHENIEAVLSNHLQIDDKAKQIHPVCTIHNQTATSSQNFSNTRSLQPRSYHFLI